MHGYKLQVGATQDADELEKQTHQASDDDGYSQSGILSVSVPLQLRRARMTGDENQSLPDSVLVVIVRTGGFREPGNRRLQKGILTGPAGGKPGLQGSEFDFLISHGLTYCQ